MGTSRTGTLAHHSARTEYRRLLVVRRPECNGHTAGGCPRSCPLNRARGARGPGTATVNERPRGERVDGRPADRLVGHDKWGRGRGGVHGGRGSWERERKCTQVNMKDVTYKD